MNRLMILVTCVLVCALVALPVRADDPPKKLTAEERKELEAKRVELGAAGVKASQAGKYSEAQKAFEMALEVARRLYPKDEFPDGHAKLATSLNNLADLYEAQGKLADAEHLYRDALAMRKRLFKGDHPDLATTLNNLAYLYLAQGKLAEAEPLLKEVIEMDKRLFKGDHPDRAAGLSVLAGLYAAQGKYADAEPLFKDALEMHKRLFKGDHPFVANSLINLGSLYQAQGKLADAEPLSRGALEMRKRLFKKDHPDVATSLNNLADLYLAQGKYADAEPLFKDALEMRQRLFKGDHTVVATSLNNLAILYQCQGKLADAKPLHKDALEMRKRLFQGDHPDVAQSLNNLADLYLAQGKYADAESLFKDALDMHKRVLKGDHPSVAASLNNLGFLYQAEGKYADAEPLFKDALEMKRRLFKGDHPDVTLSLGNMAGLSLARGKYADAEPLYKNTLDMSHRLTVAYAKQKAEGEALTFTTQLPLYRDGLLSLARQQKWTSPTPYDPAAAFPVVWTAKGILARVYEQRQLAARAASVDPELAKVLAELIETRCRRAELLLAPATTDRATRDKRDVELKTLDDKILARTMTLREKFPTSARADKLDDATAADLQKVLPADVALVDFYKYTFFEWDNTKPAGQQEIRTKRYVAFVVTREKVVWVDLDSAEKVEPAVKVWRDGITANKEIPAALAARVRELVWAPVRKELPEGTRTLYLCPDADLCSLPFAALPGDKPNTSLLEDFALATVPHAPFLLDKLWPQEPIKNPPTSALVVGGVKYDAELAPGALAQSAGPLLKPGQKLKWMPLPGTVLEAGGVTASAQKKKITVTRIEGEKATPAAVLAALPRAKYAHFAIHGFFADPSFHSVYQFDKEDYAIRYGQRVGKLVNNPLLMTGLVFAGANNPKAAGRGIVTGEQLIDLDLSGLELAVLSACETGLGDVPRDEGVYGLQRAFHYAGATNVVASLWKVPDQSTAALMALFYRNLWTQGLTPLESLRQAQLEIYKNPAKVSEWAKGFRSGFEIVAGSDDGIEVKPTKDGKAHPLFWAAFTLSGPGK